MGEARKPLREPFSALRDSIFFSRKVLLRALLSLLAGMLVFGWLTTGCAGTRPLHVQLDPDVSVPPSYAVIFFADGMDQPRMRQLLAKGRLPNIERYFVEGGVEVENTIVSLPPITYPNAVSLLTALYPGRHGILGNQWYDRDTMLFCNYASGETYRSVNEHFDAPTLYDLLSDELTVNVQCHTRRGVTHTIDNVATSAVKWTIGWFEGYDRRVGASLEEVAQFAAREGRWPAVTMFYFPGLDEVGHRAGVDSERYARALAGVDFQVGRVLDALERAGLLAGCHVVLVTDHGHVRLSPKLTFELVGWLRANRGLRIRDLVTYDEDDVEPLERLDHADVVALDGAFRHCALHLPGPDGWHSRPTREQVWRLVRGRADGGDGGPLYAQDGVGLVCIRASDDSMFVVSRDGAATVERRVFNGVREYRLLPGADDLPGAPRGTDPLGYLDDPQLAAFVEVGWHDSRTWLAATCGARYPDFVSQIVEMFASPRAGDVVVFADERWAFRHGERGGHGAPLYTDTRTSMFFAGPGVPRGGRIACGRLVDMMPTLLELLGREERLTTIGPIDGVSLVPQIRAAKGRNAE